MTTLPDLTSDHGLEGFNLPDPASETRFGSGFPIVKLRYPGDIARFYFLSDEAVKTRLMFHVQPVPTRSGRTWYADRLCLRREAKDGSDLDDSSVCPHCTDSDPEARARTMRMVALVFHDWIAHTQKINETDEGVMKGDSTYFLERVGRQALYLTKNKTAYDQLRTHFVTTGSLADAYQVPDMAAPGNSERTKLDGKVNPIDITRKFDGNRTSYSLDIRPPESITALTPTTWDSNRLVEARKEIPDLAPLVTSEYVYLPRQESTPDQEVIEGQAPAGNLPLITF